MNEPDDPVQPFIGSHPEDFDIGGLHKNISEPAQSNTLGLSDSFFYGMPSNTLQGFENFTAPLQAQYSTLNASNDSSMESSMGNASSQSIYYQDPVSVSPVNYFNNFSCMEEIFNFDVSDYLRNLDGKESLLAQRELLKYDTNKVSSNNNLAQRHPTGLAASAPLMGSEQTGCVVQSEAALQNVPPAEQSPHTHASSPKNVPPLTSGLHTRPPSPKQPDPSADWPTAWDPTQDGAMEQDLEVAEAVGVHRSVESHHDSIKCSEQDRISILEMLRFAELKVETFHRFYVRLSRISLPTLSHFLQCYFDFLHPYIPWCHKASFNPSATSGFLLGMMISLGAQYSSISGAKTFSHTLGDVIHRAVGNIVVLDTKYTRDIQLWQTTVLWSFLRCSGVKR